MDAPSKETVQELLNRFKAVTICSETDEVGKLIFKFINGYVKDLMEAMRANDENKIAYHQKELAECMIHNLEIEFSKKFYRIQDELAKLFGLRTPKQLAEAQRREELFDLTLPE